MAVAVKTTQWGGRHGCLTLVVDDIEYQRITNNTGATTECQSKPGTTPEGLTNQTTLINRTRILGLHKIVTKDYYKQESTDSIIVERVVTEAVDEIYVEELEDEYIGYSNQTIKSLIQHLKDEWCIVTTLEKKTSPLRLLSDMGLDTPHHRSRERTRPPTEKLQGCKGGG